MRAPVLFFLAGWKHALGAVGKPPYPSRAERGPACHSLREEGGRGPLACVACWLDRRRTLLGPSPTNDLLHHPAAYDVLNDQRHV